MRKELPRVTQPVRVEHGALFNFEPGNGTRMEVFMADTSEGLLVAVPNFRSAFVFPGYVTPAVGYVMEKLRLMEGDAAHMAELIKANQ